MFPQTKRRLLNPNDLSTVETVQCTFALRLTRCATKMSLIVRKFYRGMPYAFRDTGRKRGSNKFPMPARLKSTVAQADRPMGQSEKWLDDWQTIADEQTAKAFELYIARLKQNTAVASVADGSSFTV